MDRSVVARATSSDESPTPAYLYGEIAQMTHANFEGCRQLTAYLLERIKKPNHNIKFKCLQIIKVTSEPRAYETYYIRKSVLRWQCLARAAVFV